MRTGRPTDDPKDCVLKLRLNYEMYEHVVVMSSAENISMSQYIRDLIKKDMDGCKFNCRFGKS